MASPYRYQNSGGTGGVGLVGRSFESSGQIWYVSSANGTDTVSPQGLGRSTALLTVGQAYTNASAGDTIRVMAGHVETVSTSIVFAKAGIIVEGEGVGSTVPKFTCGAAIAMFDVTAAGVWFSNLNFLGTTAATPTARIRSAAVNTRISSCTFAYGSQDNAAPTVQYVTGSGQCLVEDSTFACGAYNGDSAIVVSNAMTDLELQNVSFDGGTYGWATRAFLGTAAVTRLYGRGLSFLNDSDWSFATGTSGRWNVTNATGSVRGTWTA